MVSTENAPVTRTKTSLTGIKPTGEPHLGNLIGAIEPAIAMAGEHESLYFIADYHALTTARDPELLHQWTRSVAATWLAAGLDPHRTVFYRQSDVPETFELTWILSCVTGKGLMNRAHAYKAARDANLAAGEDPDAGINMGTYNYPILMAVDILIMEADLVPVGRDQAQHVEIAADIAGSFNHLYGSGYRFRIPEAVIPAETTGHTLPGLDGRKMSKSYDNYIPLFLPAAKLRKLVRRIPTDSTPVEAPKDPDSSAVFQNPRAVRIGRGRRGDPRPARGRRGRLGRPEEPARRRARGAARADARALRGAHGAGQRPRRRPRPGRGDRPRPRAAGAGLGAVGDRGGSVGALRAREQKVRL